jgi:glycosyltransferase involved in cell wall biosynthesis
VRLRLVVPPDVDEPTGGNVYDLAVARELERARHHVELVRCSAQDLADELRRPWDGPTLVDGLLACPSPEAMTETGAAVLVHMPLAWDSSSDEEATRLNALEARTLHEAAAVVTTSEWTAADLRRRHGLAVVDVARPGVDPAPLVTGSEPPLLVQVAALLPHKNQLGVVEALAPLADLPWRLRLVGSLDRHPAYAAEVRAAVQSAGLTQRVEIAGVLARDAAWAGADLALLPSRAEAFGLVVTEALARGIPAVVSAGGAEEALGVAGEGKGGTVPGAVVPVGDVATLTGALRRWLTDPAYRSVLRGRARARRERLEGWEVTAQRVVTALTR